MFHLKRVPGPRGVGPARRSGLAGVVLAGLVAGQLVFGVASAATPQPSAARLAATANPIAVTAIATGGSHTCALTGAGGVMCWGANNFGQLGDGTTTNRTTPVAVRGLPGDVKAIAAGNNYTCALTSAGGVACWGANFYGQLGNGTTTNSATPVAVQGFFPTSDVTAITAGQEQTCALTSAGTAWCWGWNAYGQLGNGTTTNSATPVAVGGLPGAVKAIVAGYEHTCALTQAGAVWCWGFNRSGQLGNGTRTDSSVPAAVGGLLSGVTAIAAGDHTCALTSAGAVWCWGANTLGELGNGTTTSSDTPEAVRGLPSDVTAIAAGGAHTCALTSAGAMWCWGANRAGQLGDGTTTPSDVRVAVDGLPSGVTAIAAGGIHTCALTSAGAVWCWGANSAGQLGDGTRTDRSVPVAVSGLPPLGVTAIAAGGNHTCALTSAGAVWCWGANRAGQLGDGTTTNRSVPVAVSGLPPLGVTAIALGDGHTCALTSAGAVWCWGANSAGQLGDGTTTNRSLPVPVGGLPAGVTAIAAGGEHTCALTSAGAVWCWGYNFYGQLGNGTTTDSTTPVSVSGTIPDCMGAVCVAKLHVKAIAAGFEHTCALTSDGAVWCWGYNFYGQLGDGTDTKSVIPVAVHRLTSGVTAIAAGADRTCALTSAATVWCWGFNRKGLGSSLIISVEPEPVGGPPGVTTAIAAGGEHTCALIRDGAVWCWGDNRFGQVGDGTRTNYLLPVLDPIRVGGLPGAAMAIAAGAWHSCALTTAGAAWCWGRNSDGELGDGTTTDRLVPVPVGGL